MIWKTVSLGTTTLHTLGLRKVSMILVYIQSWRRQVYLLQVLHLILGVFYFIYNRRAIYQGVMVTFLKDRWRARNRYTWRLQDWHKATTGSKRHLCTTLRKKRAKVPVQSWGLLKFNGRSKQPSLHGFIFKGATRARYSIFVVCSKS